MNRFSSNKQPELKEVSAMDNNSFSTGSIISPKAKDRLFELIEREQMPGDVRETLAGALNGDLRRQQLLFTAMIDTWPRLQKNINEVLGKVAKSDWCVEAFKLRRQEVEEGSQERADFVEDAILGMKPRTAYGELSNEGLIKALARGYYTGHEVVEVLWDRKDNGDLIPKSSRVLPPRFYGYPYYEDGDDRLMLSKNGGLGGLDYEDFPEHHFLLSINGGHAGHASIAAPLRALTNYWLAAVFGLKWLLSFSQLYGIPFRWATYSDVNQEDKVCQMLESMGSSSWGAAPAGTNVEFIDASKSANSLPQKALIEMADMQCDTFILGQNLTTTAGATGSQALGNVHADVRSDVVQSVIDYTAEIFNNQLIPSIVKLNYGDDEMIPKYTSKLEKPKDELGMAQRDNILITQLGLPVTKEWIYNRHGIPVPDEDADDILTLQSEALPLTLESSHNEQGKGIVKAMDSSRSTVERLSDNVLQDITGVTREWLSPVRPRFERLAALALSNNVSDDDFIQAIEAAQKEMPEIFDELNVESLETSFKDAIGTAMLSGSVERYE